MRIRRLLVLFLALCLSGCGIKPVQHAYSPQFACLEHYAFRITTNLDLEQNRDFTLTQANIKNLRQRLRDLIKSPRLTRDEDEPVSTSMLYLSGGSLNGAFGAGLLDEWAKQRSALHSAGTASSGKRGLPRMRVVTGISTGSLQATFAFLDETPELVKEYAITDESQLLKPLVKKKVSENPLAIVTLLRRGAQGDLSPLRARLHQILFKDRDPARGNSLRVERVAADAKGRLLLVGAVEMDSGDLYAFDLTQIAAHWQASADPVEKAALENCYVESLLASSSAPMAAVPVYIDGKMFIDGGVRAGILSQRLRSLKPEDFDDDNKTDASLFIIVNGNLDINPDPNYTCNWRGCRGTNAQPGKWRFDELAMRSLDILIDQAYEGSVYVARTAAVSNGFKPRLAKMDRGKAKVAGYDTFETALDQWPDQNLSCPQWREKDSDMAKPPLQFYPRYMHCLIAYGRQHALTGGPHQDTPTRTADAWAKLE